MGFRLSGESLASFLARSTLTLTLTSTNLLPLPLYFNHPESSTSEVCSHFGAVPTPPFVAQGMVPRRPHPHLTSTCQPPLHPQPPHMVAIHDQHQLQGHTNATLRPARGVEVSRRRSGFRVGARRV